MPTKIPVVFAKTIKNGPASKPASKVFNLYRLEAVPTDAYLSGPDQQMLAEELASQTGDGFTYKFTHVRIEAALIKGKLRLSVRDEKDDTETPSPGYWAW